MKATLRQEALAAPEITNDPCGSHVPSPALMLLPLACFALAACDSTRTGAGTARAISDAPTTAVLRDAAPDAPTTTAPTMTTAATAPPTLEKATSAGAGCAPLAQSP